MKETLWVAFGGALGSSARYLLSDYILQHTLQHKFPYGTFAVNISGCLLAGIIMGIAEKHDLISPDIRLFLFTGIIGGFTTFSAFGAEVFHLLRRGDTLIAFSYILFSILCGVTVLFLAYSSIPLKK